MVRDGGENTRQVAHAALRQIRTELTRFPAITTAEGLPHGTLHTELRATVEPTFVGSDAPSGTLTVRWFVTVFDEGPQFIFHYADESGFDCGWHHYEQNHVDGLGHYQERPCQTVDYIYESVEFGSVEPSRVVWEVLSELETLLHRRTNR